MREGLKAGQSDTDLDMRCLTSCLAVCFVVTCIITHYRDSVRGNERGHVRLEEERKRPGLT